MDEQGIRSVERFHTRRGQILGSEPDDYEDYGSVRVWSGLHPKTRRIGKRYGSERVPVVRGTVILVEMGKLPRQIRKPKAL